MASRRAACRPGCRSPRYHRRPGRALERGPRLSAAIPGDAPPEGFVRYEVAGRVATLTIDRQDRLNAISPALDDELLALLDRAAADEGVHAAVIAGAGRAFSTGADTKRDEASGHPVPTSTIEDRAARELNLQRYFRIWDSPLPVIAKVHGYCLGRAVQLAVDLRRHDRRRGREGGRAAASARCGLQLRLLGVADRAEEGEGAVLQHRLDHQRHGGRAHRPLQPRRTRRSSSTTPSRSTRPSSRARLATC